MLRCYLRLLAMGLTLWAAPAVAQDTATSADGPPKDVWHEVTPDSPFFTEDMADLRAAAVVQSDDRFARIILGDGGLGAYVTVNLPGSEPAAALRSDLVYSNGGVLSRTLSAEMLEAQVMTSSDSVTYSFSIAPEDIRAFRGATKWTLTPRGGAPSEITLRGSARAIRAALNSPRPFPAAEPEDNVAQDTPPEPLQAQYETETAEPVNEVSQ